MVAAVACDPLSYVLAGALLPAGTTVVFTSCGALVLLPAAVAAASPGLSDSSSDTAGASRLRR